jgi:hypothetical protein
MSSLEDENVAALASLRSSFGGLQVAPRRGMSLCPHCHEAFGSASLSIHTRRCRMLYQYDNQDDGQNAQEKKKPMKIKPVKKLIDL